MDWAGVVMKDAALQTSCCAAAFATAPSQDLHTPLSASATLLQPRRAHKRLPLPRQLELSCNPQLLHGRPDGDGLLPFTYLRGISADEPTRADGEEQSSPPPFRLGWSGLVWSGPFRWTPLYTYLFRKATRLEPDQTIWSDLRNIWGVRA